MLIGEKRGERMKEKVSKTWKKTASPCWHLAHRTLLVRGRVGSDATSWSTWVLSSALWKTSFRYTQLLSATSYSLITTHKQKSHNSISLSLSLSLSLSSWLLQHTYYSISGDGLVVVVVVLLGITRAEDWPDDHSSGMHTAAPSALCLLLDTVCCCCKSQAATRSLKFLAKQLTTRAILLLLPTYTFFATTTTDQNENPNKRWWDGEGRKEESIHPKPIASKASRELEIQ